MKEHTFGSKLLIPTDLLELLLVGVCLYIFSTKICWLPWYTPLTSYVLLHLILVFVPQLLLVLYIWFMWEKNTSYKLLLQVSSANLFIILTMFLLSIVSIIYFYFFTIIIAFAELFMFVLLLRSTVTLLRKKV